MNYLTNIKNVTKLSQQDLHNPGKTSWHDQYKNSAWIYIGGLPFDLTEGDIICIFSQYGEVVNINLIREKDTGKSKGFCFLCYEDQRSTILAVDNLNGIKILNRSIRVDHVQDYKVPKDNKKATNETKKLHAEGCAPTPQPAAAPVPVVIKKEIPAQGYVRETLADQIEGEIKLPARLPIYVKQEKALDDECVKKDKKNKKNKSKKDASSSDSEDDRKSKKRSKVTKDRDIKKRHERRNSSEEKDKKKKYDKEDKDDSKRRDRSRSKEKDNTTKTYRREVLPNIPKRWQ